MKKAILLILMIAASLSHASALYPLPTHKQEVQFTALLKELRCLVCQNQDLADSNASLAKDLRQQVYTMVQAGQSDQEIIHYLTERYGDFILFNPPLKSITLLLWWGPGLFLLMGLAVWWISLKRPRL